LEGIKFAKKERRVELSMLMAILRKRKDFLSTMKVLFLTVLFSLHQKGKESVAGENYHLAFDTIRGQKGFDLKLKYTRKCALYGSVIYRRNAEWFYKWDICPWLQYSRRPLR